MFDKLVFTVLSTWKARLSQRQRHYFRLTGKELRKLSSKPTRFMGTMYGHIFMRFRVRCMYRLWDEPTTIERTAFSKSDGKTYSWEVKSLRLSFEQEIPQWPEHYSLVWVFTKNFYYYTWSNKDLCIYVTEKASIPASTDLI